MGDIAKGYGFRDIVNYLAQIDKHYQKELVLVGGQALIFWADYYHISDEQAEMTLLSKDIDFLGNYETAEYCSKIWAGELYKPNCDDQTPNTAKVVFSLENGKKIEVDFLAYLYGLKKSELEKNVLVKVPENNLNFFVLNPVFCLKSRL
jgi:hypothetical protein